MKVLVDQNIEGYAHLLFGTMIKEGWAQILNLEFISFTRTDLAPDSDDVTVWRYAQSHGLVILTDNRNHEDETSLAATINRENTPAALPVITIASIRRLKEFAYRQGVGLKLAEILFDLENYRGAGRIFIP